MPIIENYKDLIKKNRTSRSFNVACLNAINLFCLFLHINDFIPFNMTKSMIQKKEQS